MKKPFKRTGEVLKAFRVNVLKKTQAELIKPYELHVQAVSNWERGKCTPPTDILQDVFINNMSCKEYLKLRTALSHDLLENFLNRPRTERG